MTGAFPFPGLTEPRPSGTATTADGPAALENFLIPRGLDPEVAVRLGWTASGGFIEIPYFRDGQIKNRKYRGILDKTFRQDGGKQFFWNIDILADDSLAAEPLIITEGEFDALAAIQCGFPRVMSVPNGAPSKAETASLGYLTEVEDQLRKMPEIVLAFDDDDAGANLLHDFSIRLGKARCKWLKYPKGCKDLNDALRLYGAKGVAETIKRAQWVQVDGLYRMSEVPPAPRKIVHPIGIKGFEPHFNLRLGDFCVVTGIPGHGKSAFVDDFVSRVVSDHGMAAAVASFEQELASDHRRNLRTWYSGKLEKNMTTAEKAAADAWINKSFLFLLPNEEDDVTLEWVLEKAAVAVIRHGVKIVVIDPWNEMDHIRDKGETLTEYTGRAIKEFKRFAKKYGVFVCIVAHPAKLQRNKDGTYPVPTLYDISDSAHWYNKPDVGIVVHRGENGDIVRIAKSKFHTEIGRPGDVGVFFDTSTGRFTAKGQGPVYASVAED